MKFKIALSLILFSYTINGVENNNQLSDIKKSFTTAISTASILGLAKLGCTLFAYKNTESCFCGTIHTIVPDNDSCPTEYFSSLGEFYCVLITGVTAVDFARRKLFN